MPPRKRARKAASLHLHLHQQQKKKMMVYLLLITVGPDLLTLKSKQVTLKKATRQVIQRKGLPLF